MGYVGERSIFKRRLDRIIEIEREANRDDPGPIGGCIIEAPGYPRYHYADVKPKTARTAAAQVGATYRFRFPNRV